MTSRERVRRAVTFEHPDRVPRDLWTLPWATDRYPEEIDALEQEYPRDIGSAPGMNSPSPRVRGETYAAGTYTDEWGCTFRNVQAGVHGEVGEPILPDLSDWRSIEPPYEILPDDAASARDRVNRFCATDERFLLSGCCARPWERYQFIRGSQNALIDCIDGGAGFRGLLGKIHAYYMKELELWAGTNVDALFFMDDWGAQHQLLIPPSLWREFFKPLYRDYCGLAHSFGKFIFMHSDGCISEIYPDLVEIGVTAVNSQLFSMDMAELACAAKGRITFWGEIDRQRILIAEDPEEGRRAVREVARHLYDPAGGVIAQFELGAGANPAVARAVFEEWTRF